MKTLGEMQYGIKTEGPKAKLQVLEGSPLVIERVGFFDSDFAPGACVQCSQVPRLPLMERDERRPEHENIELPPPAKVWFVTFSETVIGVLEDNEGSEPYIATLMSHKSASDRTYWTIE